MLRVNCLLLLWLFVTIPLFGQYTSIRTRAGYGGYGMNDLKEWHRDIENGSLPIASTSTFPAYLNLQIQFVNHSPDKQIGLGFVWDHVSTGGRLAYSDYSGELQADQFLNAESIGALYERNLLITERLSVVPSVQLLFTFTSLQYEEYLHTSAEVSSTTVLFQSFGAGVSPEVTFRYKIGSWMFSVGGGYHISASQPLAHVGYSRVPLSFIDYSPIDIKPQWSGLRAGITLGKTFGEVNGKPLIVLGEDNNRLIYKGGLIPRFCIGSHQLKKPGQIKPLITMQHDEQLNVYFQEYRTNFILGNILGAIGGTMIGWPIGASFGGEEFNQPMFIAGMSFTTLGMIFQELASDKARKVAQRYNFLLQ